MYSLLVANPLMLFAAYRLDHADGRIKLHELTAWYALAGATALALLGAGMLFAVMNPKRRHTFYVRKTLREYIDEW